MAEIKYQGYIRNTHNLVCQNRPRGEIFVYFFRGGNGRKFPPDMDGHAALPAAYPDCLEAAERENGGTLP